MVNNMFANLFTHPLESKGTMFWLQLLDFPPSLTKPVIGTKRFVTHSGRFIVALFLPNASRCDNHRVFLHSSVLSTLPCAPLSLSILWNWLQVIDGDEFECSSLFVLIASGHVCIVFTSNIPSPFVLRGVSVWILLTTANWRHKYLNYNSSKQRLFLFTQNSELCGRKPTRTSFF